MVLQKRSQMPLVCGWCALVFEWSISSMAEQRWYSWFSIELLYSVPQSVNMRNRRTERSSYQGKTRSLSKSAAVMACLLVYDLETRSWHRYRWRSADRSAQCLWWWPRNRCPERPSIRDAWFRSCPMLTTVLWPFLSPATGLRSAWVFCSGFFF